LIDFEHLKLRDKFGKFVIKIVADEDKQMKLQGGRVKTVFGHTLFI
jgi:hypothetical protein